VLKYDAVPGETIKEAAAAMSKMANEMNQQVKCVFNDIELIADVGCDLADTIVAQFWKESDRRSKEYAESEEYKKQRIEMDRKHNERLSKQKAMLDKAPFQMSLMDHRLWKVAVETNKDGYGSCVVRYADKWARLMELQMSEGVALESCAEEMAHLADDEGITGFMYGCAVGILAKVWLHGESLRVWHNLDCQISNEGEKANSTGGILNPALLNVRVGE